MDQHEQEEAQIQMMRMQLMTALHLARRLTHICSLIGEELGPRRVYMWPTIYAMNDAVNQIKDGVEKVDCEIANEFVRPKEKP